MPGSLVGDPHACVTRRLGRADRDRPAVGGVLDRVREDVADDLREPRSVAVDAKRLVGKLELELVALVVPERHLGLLAHEGAQVERLAAERETALLDQAGVEEVAHERCEPRRLGVDDLEVPLPVRFRQVALQQKAREPEHARERRAHLVRHHADELRLVALGLREALGALDQFAPARGERLGHCVEHVRELAELVAPAIVQTDIEVAGSDGRRRDHRLAQRIGDDASEPQAEQDEQDGSEHERDDPRDRRLVGQVSRRGTAVRGDRSRVPGDRVGVRDDLVESQPALRSSVRRADRKRRDPWRSRRPARRSR